MSGQHPLGPLGADMTLRDASEEKPESTESMWDTVEKSCSRFVDFVESFTLNITEIGKDKETNYIMYGKNK